MYTLLFESTDVGTNDYEGDPCDWLKETLDSCRAKDYTSIIPLKNMVEIECPLCAEPIDLGMAEEEEYECPYCEDVFSWEPDKFRDIGNLQCPKGCGQLSYVSFGEIGYHECQICKGSLLNAKNIGTILKDESDKGGTLESLLEQGMPCDLDCPMCEGNMVKITVYYKPPRRRRATGLTNVPKSLPELALRLLIAAPIVAHEMSKRGFLDGCGDCGSLWFDKGELDRIRKSRSVELDGEKFRRID